MWSVDARVVFSLESSFLLFLCLHFPTSPPFALRFFFVNHMGFAELTSWAHVLALVYILYTLVICLFVFLLCVCHIVSLCAWRERVETIVSDSSASYRVASDPPFLLRSGVSSSPTRM